MPGPVHAHVRAAIEAELLEPRTPPRSRAAIAREHDVSTRTVSRFAEQLGIDDGAPFRTDTIATATQAATDRRRAKRSELADLLLTVEVPRLLERMAGAWQRTVVIPGMDARTEQAVEDDATIARGLKELHTALNLAVRQTIDIDKADADTGDTAATQTLDRLFGGLDLVYERVTGRRPGQPDDDREVEP